MFNYYLQLAVKSLKRTPITTLLMVLAIACGIGISMTALTLFYMTNTNPIPEKSTQLYALQLQASGKTTTWSTHDNVPVQITYQDARNLTRAMPELRHTPMFKTGFSVRSLKPEFTPILQTARVTNRHFFSMFNIKFLYGSAWNKTVDENPTLQVVIDDKLNQKLFGGGNNVGKEILLDNKQYQIVGIIENWQPKPKFYDLNNGGFQDAEQVFIPWILSSVHELPSWGNNNGWKSERITSYDEKRESENLWLQYWVELPSAQEKENFQQFLMGYVAEQKKLARFEREDARGVLRNVEQWLDYNKVVSDDSYVLVAVSFMFLAVCLVNSIGLLLAKFLRSAPSVGVRRALGASRGQVFAQHLVEVGLLGLIGGIVGLLFAVLGLSLLKSNFDGFDFVASMDLTMLIAAPVIAISATVLAGIYPAWRVCTTLPSIYLKTQ
ncbi:ABC macrolide family export system permease 2 [Thalassotalea insulae]|uniref:ABC macrolide family export system permease 2 n=1 Tax=Thalassotalea insulae TaxID=2056778 RepID=A0ABQ6GVW6_9GAMM|nr:ABC transporter permease [Thalassotalea insulae]GLX79489.1 ABC macrolide family export system permease 2 [Thalassotalea insulae]